ncbi:histone-domain-containing protein, partial [Sphaerulina musiva SO2202]
KSTELLIRRLLFLRICREITIDLATNTSNSIYRFQAKALLCLKEQCESIVTKVFSLANLLAIYYKRVIVIAKDLECLRRLLKE